ncbi:MAG: DNA primase [Pseudopedobacter saltans]|uniref:DNA primase n=1 Tax=Pseudopedobacter saltans TaxID=151895 RepID=A0A2W5EUN0_9SPHI|nr:MAG: DNA primase [Pseudopedobacter saltans]
MITPQTIQRITDHIDIVDVIGEFVKLKKRGANYLGNCPFHGEKTPSFTVSPSKEIFKCFGCGKSGNTITFLMEHEHIGYVDALKWLANRYNIEVEETEVSDEAREARQLSDSLFIVNQFAQKFFTDQLNESEDGRDIGQSYLYERGFTTDTIEKFQLGYNPKDRDIFYRSAIHQQYNPEILLKTGLVSQRANGEIIDNYRDRIIFPVHNVQGKILGFGARVIGKPPANAPKYINTPENEIYVKSKILYGIYFSRQAIDRLDECYLVEGYTDVISLFQAGVENVVSSGGTSLTTDQLRLIKKYTNNLTIIYDGDAAGVKAAMRGLDMAIEQGLNVHLVLIPDNEDPDSYVKKVGEEDFRKFVAENKKDIILFQLDVMLSDAGNDVNKKNDAVNHIAETLSKIDRTEDFTKLQDYIRRCSDILKIDEGGLTNLVNKYKRDKLERDERRHQNTSSDETAPVEEVISNDALLVLNKDLAQEKNIVRVLLEYGLEEWEDEKTVANFIFEQVDTYRINDEPLNNLFLVYRKEYESGNQPTTKTIQYSGALDLQQLIADITIFPYQLSSRWDEKLGNSKPVEHYNWKEDVDKSVTYYLLHKIMHLKNEVESKLKEENNSDNILTYVRVYQHLKNEETRLTQALGTVIVK